MKTKRAFSLGFAALLALVAVIGFTACSDDSGGSGTSNNSELYGTYKETTTGAVTITLTSSGWSMSTGVSGTTWTYDGSYVYCYYTSTTETPLALITVNSNGTLSYAGYTFSKQ